MRSMAATDSISAICMKMPPEVLTFLLRGGHLNVEERKAKGLWPNERLPYSEVVDHLAAVIEGEGWFPRMIQPADSFLDRITVQRLDRDHFVCHGSKLLRDVGEQPIYECRNAQKAAAFYLKYELGIPPATLDSWIVE